MIDFEVGDGLPEAGVFLFELLPDVFEGEEFFFEVVESEIPFLVEFAELVLVFYGVRSKLKLMKFVKFVPCSSLLK